MSKYNNRGCCGKGFMCGYHGAQGGTRECAKCRSIVDEEIQSLKSQLAERDKQISNQSDEIKLLKDSNKLLRETEAMFEREE